MTITTNDDRDEYTATAGQTVFNYTFKIYSTTDLNVYQTPAVRSFDDAADIITGYTVSGVGSSSGGTITLNTGAAAGDRITIVSAIPSSRTTDYQNNGDFTPATVNDDFDRAVSLIKQAEGIGRRALLFPESQQNTTALTLPAPEALRLVRWKNDLSGLENTGLPTITVSQSPETTVDDTSAMTAISKSSLVSNQRIVTLGYAAPGDGGANEYYWDASSATTADNVFYFASDEGGAGRFISKITNRITAKQAGAVGSGDVSSAIQAALDGCDHVVVTPSSSVYRVDSMLTVADRKELEVLRGAEVKRTTDTSNADPVIFLRGINSKLTGTGTIRTDNHHPEGVVLCGHRDNTVSTNYNAQKWRVGPLDIYGRLAGSTGSANTTVGTTPGTSANIGIFITSSQPYVGSSVSNYFGNVDSGCKIQQADVGICLTDQANAHQFGDIFMQDIFGAYVMTHGAYGNVFNSVWCHRSLDANCVPLYLRDKLDAGATYVAGHDSYRNMIHGFQNESGNTAGTVQIESGSADNWVEYQHNAAGSAVTDANGNNWFMGLRGALKVETLEVTTGASNLTITASATPTLTFLDSDETVVLSRIVGDNNGTMSVYAGEGGGSGIYRVYTAGTERFRIDNAVGNITPGTDGTQNLGSTSLRFNNTYSEVMTLVDGVSAPSTVSGHAQIYVDSADGDLKVKFGDGTVKTIATDT